nr:MAG TPA: hypothetical protein [Caudoviricetes sp.]
MINVLSPVKELELILLLGNIPPCSSVYVLEESALEFV